ncbi:hypothetical protein BU16DRAFT_527926 [Lophium mytilinum]|uniref:Uncharacterized protein n=1 Tax=Lophium mytilinum TaxID=390894 RepID=A0A6A6QNL9_9PEZI|nr:hypothetical protein BU16DRAFT_527926 [Lophium mytilinum]
MPAIPIAARASAAQVESSIRSLLPRLSTAAARLLRRIPLPSIAATSKPRLESRAVAGIIPTYYEFNGPTPGTTAGIVLGSVAGFLFLIWLFYSLFGGNMFAVAGGEEVVVRRRGSRSPGHSRRSRRSTRTEVREVSRSPRRERVIVEERRERPRPRSIIVEERSRVPGDDIVEVIEEEDIRPPRRGSGRRGSGYGY